MLLIVEKQLVSPSTGLSPHVDVTNVGLNQVFGCTKNKNNEVMLFAAYWIAFSTTLEIVRSIFDLLLV